MSSLPILRFARVALLVFVSIGAGGTSACGCKLIACFTGLRVRLDSPPAAPYRVEAFASATGPRFVAACDATSACPTEVWFTDFLPSRVSVEVIAGTDTLRREFTSINYETSQPVGGGCSECRSGTVIVR